jgi:hypothetical protein
MQNFRKKQFSQPWRGRFPRSNSRSTYGNPNISSGVFKISFGALEGSQKSPKRWGSFSEMWHFLLCRVIILK